MWTEKELMGFVFLISFYFHKTSIVLTDQNFLYRYMYKKLFLLPLFFLTLIFIFVFSKIGFLLYNHGLYAPFHFADYLNVILNGLKHDASIAGYVSAIPGLMLIASCWGSTAITKWPLRIYIGVIAVLLSIIWIVDAFLYEHWGFRLDSSVLFYLESPKEALASTHWLVNVGGLLVIIFLSVAVYKIFIFVFKSDVQVLGSWKRKLTFTFILLFEVALLFLPIRGGLKESTMNVGKVYFSDEVLLNHAAINPAFSLFESLSTTQQFNQQFRFMNDEEAVRLFANLQEQPTVDSIPRLFTIARPNIVLVVLESFMSLNIAELGGMPGVAVHLDSLSREGILFSNMYANSFRTDRALVSILSAIPGQPSTSMMKYPRKLQKTPSFPAKMKKEGYDLQYIYGGDADFTSMRSYLRMCGFENIVEDISFPSEYNNTKWGVPDHHVFNRLYDEIKQQSEKPFLKVIQTLSSHNPYDVPYKGHLKDPYLNSVAYTDSCLGDFINRFRQLPAWDNTVVIMVPDHAMRYPYDLDNRSVERYKIPLVMVGGAVAKPERINTYASQIDIAATLLYQLEIDYKEFIFSKNILNSESPHFGFFTFKDGFGMVSNENEYVFDNESNTVTTNTKQVNFNEQNAKAFLQKLFDYLGAL